MKPTIHRQINIPYHSLAFKKRVVNGRKTLTIWPEDLLWAAVTVGRGNFLDVLAHGLHSQYEMMYRVSMILANLTYADKSQLTKSSAFLHLDPSEKGAFTYFLGMTMCKLFASRLLHIPWLLHLEVYRDRFHTTYATGSRKRPDLIGLDLAKEWFVMESKGRTHSCSRHLLNTAKEQTRCIRSINGQYPDCRIAAITHFSREGILSFNWEDPEDHDDDAENLETSTEEFLSTYYSGIFNILSNNAVIETEEYLLYGFPHLGFTVGMRTSIFEAYRRQLLDQVEAEQKEQRFIRLKEVSGQLFFRGIDGIVIGINNAIRQSLFRS